MKPKIVFAVNSMFAVRHLLPELLSLVRQRGFEVFVVAPLDEGSLAPATISATGVHFRDVPLDREIAPFSDLRAVFRLWRLFRAIRPDITNLSTPKMAFLGGLAAFLAGVPQRIYTIRGLRYETTASWKRFVLQSCERIACACAHQVISISQSVREALLKDHIATPHKVKVLGERVSEGIVVHRVCASRSSITELRRKTGIPDGAQVIGFVGRMTRDKGIDDLAGCMRLLEGQGRRVHLLLLGDFEEGDPVRADTVEWIRTSPRVHWLGYVPDPQPYYPILDLFIFPTHREGLGKVLLEAAAAGKPVVSTYTTGVVDVVQDGVTGILVPPGDPRALARATATLLDDGALAARMGAAARKAVEEHFDNTIYLQRLGSMLESLASRNASAGVRA